MNCGFDVSSSYFLKVAANALAFPSSYFSFCLKLGIFSDCLKIRKAINCIYCIFKSGNKSDITNYRPISILSPIYQIPEKLIYFQTTTVFDKHSVFLPTQFGFRPKHSLHTSY